MHRLELEDLLHVVDEPGLVLFLAEDEHDAVLQVVDALQHRHLLNIPLRAYTEVQEEVLVLSQIFRLHNIVIAFGMGHGHDLGDELVEGHVSSHLSVQLEAFENESQTVVVHASDEEYFLLHLWVLRRSHIALLVFSLRHFLLFHVPLFDASKAVHKQVFEADLAISLVIRAEKRDLALEIVLLKDLSQTRAKARLEPKKVTFCIIIILIIFLGDLFVRVL